jgi:hypothetical protein
VVVVLGAAFDEGNRGLNRPKYMSAPIPGADKK